MVVIELKMQQKLAGPHPIYPGPQGSLSIKRTPIVLDLLLVVPQKADLTAMHLLATLDLIIYKLCWSVLCIYNTPTGSITSFYYAIHNSYLSAMNCS